VGLRGGIRRRLWLGIGGLLLVLLLTAGLAVRVGWQSNAAIEQTFRDNGDSLAYMHELTDALDQVDARARAPEGAGASGAGPLPALRAAVDRNIASELANTTELGEREAALSLQAVWQAYQAALPGALARGASPAQRRERYRAGLEPKYRRLRALAWEIAGLNLGNARFRGHDRDLLAAELRWMVLLLLAGVAVGVAFAVQTGRSLVDPVVALTQGVRELGLGRLDGQVAVTGDDELSELGRAFNAMARRLNDFERGFRAKLLRTQRTTQLAINSCSDPVAVFGLDHKVDLCNRAAEELFGLRPGACLEPGPLAALGPRLGLALEQAQAYEPAGYAAALRVERQGQERYILPRLQAVLDGQGRTVGAILVLADVTGLRRMDELKSGLLATVSHELKNPLTSLRMAAHLLQEDAEAGRTGRQAALLAALKENADRLHGVLDGLLDLGRLESGDLLRLEVRQAGELLEELLRPLAAALEAQGLSLERVVAPGLPAVAVDAGRLKHVFTNLLDNAARHSPAGGCLQVGAAQEAGGVRFWVQDSGPGVPPEFRSRVFERFFRVPGQAQGSGLGLGLAIARELVELHGGQLQLDPSPRGARFSMLLPLV
jgi:signal transduction histidine kinase